MLVAMGLLVKSITFLVWTAKNHEQLWIWIGTAGLVGILAAFSNGLSFLDFNRDFSSFIMAMGYIVATISYVIGLCIAPQASAPTAKK